MNANLEKANGLLGSSIQLGHPCIMTVALIRLSGLSA